MPKPRFSGGSTSMRSSSSQMPPAVSGCNPAMQLSAVDLPQPDGPSSAMNSPRPISRSRLRSAATGSPSAFVKLRHTESSRNRSKECFMLPPAGPPRGRHRPPRVPKSLRLLRADIAVPFLECGDHCLRGKRYLVRTIGDPLVVLGTAVPLDHVLAMRGGLGKRHVLHGWTRIEIAVVVGQRL